MLLVFLFLGEEIAGLYCCGFSADSSKTHNPSGGYFPYICRIFVGQMMFSFPLFVRTKKSTYLILLLPLLLLL